VGEMVPLHAARIEDLGPGDFGKVDCAAHSEGSCGVPRGLRYRQVAVVTVKPPPLCGGRGIREWVILRHRSGNSASCLTRRNPASSRGHGTGRLWDPTTGEPLGAPMKHEGVQGAVFDKVEGRTLSWSQDKIVRP
jgi:hypothetical protein